MPSFSFSEPCSGYDCLFCGPIEPRVSYRGTRTQDLPRLVDISDRCFCCDKPTYADGSCACGWNPDVTLADHYPVCSGEPLPF